MGFFDRLCNYTHQLVMRTKLILQEIRKWSPETDLRPRHFICIDNKRDLRGEYQGLNTLWTNVITRIDKEGLPSHFFAQLPRLDHRSQRAVFEKSRMVFEDLDNITKHNNNSGMKITKGKSITQSDEIGREISVDRIPASEPISLTMRQAERVGERIVHEKESIIKFAVSCAVGGATIGVAIGGIGGPIGSAMGGAIGAAAGRGRLTTSLIGESSKLISPANRTKPPSNLPR